MVLVSPFHSNFRLPDPAGRAGGACTSTLLNILYKDEHTPDETLSFIEVLDQMRDNLKEKGFSQIPQLTSTQELDLNHKFEFVPDDFHGTKRAIMIGINYVGHDPGELVSISLSHNRSPLVFCVDLISPFSNLKHSADATMMLETWYVVLILQSFWFPQDIPLTLVLVQEKVHHECSRIFRREYDYFDGRRTAS